MTKVESKIASSDTIRGQHEPRGGLDEQHPDAEQRGVKVDKWHRLRERGDLISDPQLKVRGPLCLMCHDDGVPLATLWGHGVHVISQLDHLTRPVKFTHRAPPAAIAAAHWAWGEVTAPYPGIERRKVNQNLSHRGRRS
jgi:hypothetical protein